MRSVIVLINRTSDAAKLFAAALVFTTGFVAFSACSTAASRSTAAAREDTAATASVLPAATASTLPATGRTGGQFAGQTQGRPSGRLATQPGGRSTRGPAEDPSGQDAAEPGVLTVSPLQASGPGCARSYVARTYLVNPVPGGTVHFRWKLTRWSPATRTWRTYLSGYDGLAAGRAVEWRAEPSGSPGWYRVELTTGGGETVKSRRFRVSC